MKIDTMFRAYAFANQRFFEAVELCAQIRSFHAIENITSKGKKRRSELVGFDEFANIVATRRDRLGRQVDVFAKALIRKANRLEAQQESAKATRKAIQNAE